MDYSSRCRTSEEETNDAILRIAYLLAASDGEVKKPEREVFKKTLDALYGSKMGDEDTTALIEGVVEGARKLMALRDFYNEEQMTKAFLSKVRDDLRFVRRDKVSARKAFAVWISLCIADKDYSSFERHLVKALQSACNDATYWVRFAFARGEVVKALQSACNDATPSLFGFGRNVVDAFFRSEDGFEDTPDSEEKPLVSDDFLLEVEDRCREIDEARAQLDSCASNDQKYAMAASLESLVASFNEFVVNIDD